jgi:cleavage stimulation factor subunit 2
VRLIYDKVTNRPKGFGFCEFADQQGAERAITNLNGADFNGRALRVNWANKYSWALLTEGIARKHASRRENPITPWYPLLPTLHHPTHQLFDSMFDPRK